MKSSVATDGAAATGAGGALGTGCVGSEAGRAGAAGGALVSATCGAGAVVAFGGVAADGLLIDVENPGAGVGPAAPAAFVTGAGAGSGAAAGAVVGTGAAAGGVAATATRSLVGAGVTAAQPAAARQHSVATLRHFGTHPIIGFPATAERN